MLAGQGFRAKAGSPGSTFPAETADNEFNREEILNTDVQVGQRASLTSPLMAGYFVGCFMRHRRRTRYTQRRAEVWQR